MMIFKRYISLLLVSMMILVSGCTTHPNLYTSVAVIKKNDTERNRIIIDDLLGFLQRYYAPAQTTFVIDPDKSRENLKFAEQFENRFRNAGFAISREKIAGGIPLAWKIDRVGWLVRATYYIDNAVITRVYKPVGSSWVPVGPFSAENMGSPKYNSSLLNELTKSSRASKAGVYGKIIADVLRIREKPSTHSKVIGRLKYGQKVSVAYKLKTGAGELWTKLKHSKGYVSSKYLRIVGG